MIISSWLKFSFSTKNQFHPTPVRVQREQFFCYQKISWRRQVNTLFSSSELALEYQKSGDMKKGHLAQETPVSKDAKRLSLDKSTLFAINYGGTKFGSESTNWMMKQKIILEVVPCRYKASVGVGP
jgi:hypothetical protein